MSPIRSRTASSRGNSTPELLATSLTSFEILQREPHGLYRCHRALELDADDHDYNLEEWLPTVCDIAAPLLRSARLDTEPPTLVQVAQEAISWLSRAIAERDEDSMDAPTSLAEALARLLVVWSFTDT